MPTREQLLTGLRKADAAGDVPAAKAFARAIKGLESAPERGVFENALRGFNEAIAPIAAPLYDVPAWAIEKVTGEPTQSYREKFVGDDPATPGGRIARSAGNLAGLALPIGAGMNIAGQATARLPAAVRAAEGPVRKVVGDLMVSRAAAPLASLVGDVAGGLGAGAAGQYVEESGMEPGLLKSTAKVGAELTGGLLSEVAASGGFLGKAAKYGYDRGRAGINAITNDEAGVPHAAKRVREVIASPDSALRGLESEYTVPLTPAQKIDDPGAYALQKAAIAEDQGVATAIRALNAKNRVKLTEQLAELKGPGGDPHLAVKRRAAVRTATIRQQYENRVADIEKNVADSATRRTSLVNERKQYLDSLVAQARKTADEQIATLAPDMGEEEASRIYRAALDRAEEDATQEGRKLWDAVPGAIPVKTHGALADYQAIKNKLSQAQQDDIRPYADFFVQNKDAPSPKFLGLQSNIKEVSGLRSKLLADARSYNQPGQESKRARALELAASLLKTLEGVDGMEPKLRAALDFTRMTKQRFGQPDVSEVLGSIKTGAARVPDPETLRSMVGAGGPAASSGVEQALVAVPGSEKIVEAYLKNQFRRQVYPAGKFSVDAAEKFITNNETMLERFPEFSNSIYNSISASRNLKSDTAGFGQMKRETDVAAKAATRVETAAAKGAIKAESGVAAGRSERYTSKFKSYTAKFLKTDPSQLLDTALDSPPGFARTVKNNVKGNATAQEGLREATIDRLIEKSGRTFDLDGNPVVSGSKLLGHIRESRGVLGEWLTKDQIDRAEFIAEQLARIERSEAASPAVDGLSTYAPSKLIATAARVAGVRTVGKMESAGAGFGGSLQIANITSNRIGAFIAKHSPDRVHKKLVEGIMNEKGMTRLLTEISNTPVKKPLRGRVRLPAWVVAPTAEQEKRP